MKQQVNIRLSDATREKLDQLTKQYGTQTEVMAVAIDRLFKQQIEWMKEHPGYVPPKKRMTKTELDQFVKSADSVTTLQSDFGQWGAIIHKDGQDYEAWTDALDPEGDAMVEPISRDEAERAIIKDHRTVLR